MIRTLSTVAMITCVLLLAGCEFTQQYNHLAQSPPNSAQPLIGAYQGTWHRSERFGAAIRGGAAHAVIDTQSDSELLELAVELDQHLDLLNGQLYAGSITVDPKASSEFQGKLPLGVALVMEVHGTLDGQSLTVHYTITDVSDPSVQHENGTLHLTRVHGGS